MKKLSGVTFSLFGVWPLLFGIFVIAMSQGLQGTLLGLRATDEGFDVTVIGWVMASYNVGFLLGCRFIPSMLASVGHIRVFAALASLASTAILIHGVFVDPAIWMIGRIMTGFCFCGLYLITESWLNQVAKKRERGTILSAYIMIINAGLFGGQFMINLAPLDSTVLFILTSLLISLALAPITLTNRAVPKYKKSPPIGIIEMLKKYPLPMAGVFTAGAVGSTVHALGPSFASEMGLTKNDVAFFMGTFILGNAMMPIFFGVLSDRMDRRIVIYICAIAALITCSILSFTGIYHTLVFMLGGFLASLYSISITFLNDQIKKGQIVSAGRTMLMFSGAGSFLGPVLGGALLSRFGTDSFFISMTCYLAIFCCVVSYRLIVGNAVKTRRAFVTMSPFAASTLRLTRGKSQADIKASIFSSPSVYTPAEADEKKT